MPARIGRLAFLALFALVIGLPPVVALLAPLQTTAETEKRRLEPPPRLAATAASLVSFPRRFEAFYNDHFGLRDLLITWHNRTLVRLLGVPSQDGVELGKDGWLYYGGRAMRAYRGTEALPDWWAERWRLYLEGMRDWLAERGIRYLVVFTPDKQTIYPEHVADRNNVVGPTPLDRLAAHLQTASDLEVLDLRPVLEAAKGAGPLYDRTDSHWNDLGAYQGYRAILERVGRWYPDLGPRPPQAFTVRSQVQEGGNLAQFLGVQDVVSDTHVAMEPVAPPCAVRTELDLEAPQPWGRSERPFRTTCAGAPARHLLMFRDSFSNALVPFLAEDFGQATFVWQASTGHPFDDTFPLLARLVATEKPDVVVNQLLERKLTWPVDLPPELLAATARRKFRDSADVRLALAPVPAARLKPVQQVAVDTAAGTTLLTTSGPQPVVALPPFTPSADGWPVVRIRLRSRVATTLRLAYPAPKGKGGAWESVVAPVNPGVNEVYLELPGDGGSGTLLLSPGTVPGTYAFEAVEVRQRHARPQGAPR